MGYSVPRNIGAELTFEVSMSSLVQSWAESCSSKEQLILLKAIRGADSIPRSDSSRIYLTLFREDLLKAEFPTPSYLQNTRPNEHDIKEFFSNIDHYSIHWLLHFLYAAEVMSYRHPTTSVFWDLFYQEGCKALHFNPETAEQMTDRLKDQQKSPFKQCV
jgi:hypothetical protein